METKPRPSASPLLLRASARTNFFLRTETAPLQCRIPNVLPSQMSRKRKTPTEPGAVFRCPETGELVEIDEHGEEVPFVPTPWDPDFKGEPDALDDIPRRADGSVSPLYELGQDDLERLDQPNMTHDTARARRTRHDGWTLERQKHFIETLAATASVSDACRYVGLSRQSANKLYNRSPQFRAAWDEALKASVNVLATTAFDRAVNGTQEQVWHEGRMIGFKEKHHDQLLIYLLRVRDPLNFAPLDDLAGWQRHRAIDQRPGGIAPTLDRLEAAERAWASADQEPPQLTAPADHLEAPAPSARPGLAAPAPDLSTLTTSSTSRAAERVLRTPSTPTTSSTSCNQEHPQDAPD